MISIIPDILKKILGLFARITIQNNVGEGSNSVIQSLLKLSGPKTETSVEKKLRAFVIVRNNPEIINEIKIDLNMRGDFIINSLIPPELAQLMSRGCTLERK